MQDYYGAQDGGHAIYVIIFPILILRTPVYNVCKLIGNTLDALYFREVPSDLHHFRPFRHVMTVITPLPNPMNNMRLPHILQRPAVRLRTTARLSGTDGGVPASRA